MTCACSACGKHFPHSRPQSASNLIVSDANRASHGLRDPVCGSTASLYSLLPSVPRCPELPLRTLLAMPAAGTALSLPVALPGQMQAEQSDAPGLRGSWSVSTSDVGCESASQCVVRESVSAACASETAFGAYSCNRRLRPPLLLNLLTRLVRPNAWLRSFALAC